MKKLLRKKDRVTSTPTADRHMFTGLLPKGKPHPTVDDLVLIHHTKAPKDRNAFPAVTELVPPDTYHVFSKSLKRVVYMASIDALGTLLAWDTDKDGRYFMSGRALIAPRFIEYCWDSSVAIAAGEKWDIHHRDYYGTLASKPAPSKLSPPISSGCRQPKRQEPVKPPATQPAKPLKRLAKATVDTDILKGGVLDQGKLNSAAHDVADKYANAFPAPVKKLRKVSK